MKTKFWYSNRRRIPITSGTKMFRELPKTIQVAGWFLLVTYVLGSLSVAVMEYQSQVLSERFDYPPELIYFTCLIQLVCAILLTSKRLAPLTVLSLGAVASHLRIHSPLTALPAVGYTFLQIWFGFHAYKRFKGRNDS